jgi:hypothetical protein
MLKIKYDYFNKKKPIPPKNLIFIIFRKFPQLPEFFLSDLHDTDLHFYPALFLNFTSQMIFTKLDY